MKPVLSLLFLVAAPRATCTTLVPPARPVHNHQHVSAVSPHHLEPFLPAPSYTTAPCPLQQFTPTPRSRPSTAPPTRPPFMTCEPDVTTASPTPATPYPTPHTSRRFKPIPPANHRHMLPPPQSKNMYFHIPVHTDPFIHTPRTKKKTRTRSTPSRRTHVPQLSPPASHNHKIFIAIQGMQTRASRY